MQRVSCVSCCVTSDSPVPPWAACPSDLGKGLRGHCGFCRPEPPKVIIGVWPCLPRGPSRSSPVSAHRIPLGPQGTRVKKRTQQNGGWSWGWIPASAQPLALCDCSGPRFSLCAVGQQPSSAPSPRVPREVAPDMEEEEAGKKKKSKGLATVFSVFTKRRKKKGKPSLAETEGESESSLQPPAQLPTGRREPLPRWSGCGQDGGSLEWMPRSAGTERAGHAGVKGLPSLLSPAAPDLRI